jgi:serine/threonine-protein kinase
MTGVDELLGTPDFMSPEQARGRVVDLRTDLYSLGVLVFKCLTGRLPYEKTMPLPELLISITQREPALASVYRSDLPAAVITWLGRALQKEPAKRFATAKEMGDAFADACTTRRMVVNVPRVSTAAEDEAHGEEHTARAPGVAMGEDTTLLARSDDGIGEDHTVRAPSGIAAAPTTQSSPGIVRPPSHPPSHPPSSHPPTKPADPSIGEDVTLRGEEKPELPRIEEKPIVREPGPPSGARAQPVPPSGFRVEKTLPLDADPAAFAAARALPVKKDVSRSPSNPPEAFSIPPAPPRTGMSLTVTIAIAMFVLAVVAVVWWGFHASAEVPVR